MSITSAFFRKLSLRAEQNWHQNSGANRRDSIRLLTMASPRSCRQSPQAGFLQRDVPCPPLGQPKPQNQGARCWLASVALAPAPARSSKTRGLAAGGLASVLSAEQ